LTIKPIKSDKELDAALREISRIFHARPGTKDGDRVEILTLLVEAYEKEHYPMPPPDPIEAIKFCLDQQGKNSKALIGVLGSRSRVYEVLRGDRPLTLTMIRRLHKEFAIPAEILIRPAKVRSRRVKALSSQKRKAA
jgi:HTH-type transcriptional regulator/antitoxin HigA